MPDINDPAVWMWSRACELLDEAERMHRQFFRPHAAAEPFVAWQPPVDVLENEHEVVVLVAMPGVARDRLELWHDTGWLIVRGTRPPPLAGHAVHQLELPYGRFERRIALPQGALELTPPRLADGCLTVTLNKVNAR
jgi:HSP20 family molecular chaperone IbpA